MKNIFLFVAITLNISLYSQSFQTDWRQCFGSIGIDEANDVCLTASGYYILGTANEKDIWLIKTDLEGNLLWDKKFGGTQVDYAMRLIPATQSQFYIIGGTFSSDGDITFDPYPTSRDYWIVKIDSMGNKIWDKVYGGNDRDEVWNGCYSYNDELIIAGWSLSSDGDVPMNYGYYDNWILKLDSAGNKVWNTIIGTNGQDFPGTIHQTNDDGYIFAGTSLVLTQSSGNIPCVDPYKDAELFLIKLDYSGNIEWTNCYGGSNKEGATDIIEVNDGYIAACYTSSNDGDLLNSGYHIGFFNSGAPTSDAWVIKFDHEGNIIWDKCYGGSKDDVPYRIFQTTKGFRLFSIAHSFDGDVDGNHSWSDTYSDIWTLEIDSIGNLLSNQCFGSVNFDKALSGIVQVHDYQYTIGGFTISSDWNCLEEYDIFLMKITDTLGVGINEPEIDKLSNVYPNPAKDFISIENIEGMPVEFTITDMRGIRKERIVLSPGVSTISLKNYTPGLYCVNYVNKNRIVTGKFIILK